LGTELAAVNKHFVMTSGEEDCGFDAHLVRHGESVVFSVAVLLAQDALRAEIPEREQHVHFLRGAMSEKNMRTEKTEREKKGNFLYRACSSGDRATVWPRLWPCAAQSE